MFLTTTSCRSPRDTFDTKYAQIGHSDDHSPTIDCMMTLTPAALCLAAYFLPLSKLSPAFPPARLSASHVPAFGVDSGPEARPPRPENPDAGADASRVPKES